MFFLLQTVYHEFDIIAKKRQVFKVETVGDSYVAVAGLPDPQPDHAVIMGRFASDCLHAMIMIARDLETKLGPDTGELCMRFGKSVVSIPLSSFCRSKLNSGILCFISM